MKKIRTSLSDVRRFMLYRNMRARVTKGSAAIKPRLCYMYYCILFLYHSRFAYSKLQGRCTISVGALIICSVSDLRCGYSDGPSWSTIDTVAALWKHCRLVYGDIWELGYVIVSVH